MPYETHALDIKSADGTGAAFEVSRFTDKWVQVGEDTAGSIDATVTVEGTMDDVNWVDVLAITAPGVIEVLPAFTKIRITTSDYVLGTLVAKLSGNKT